MSTLKSQQLTSRIAHDNFDSTTTINNRSKQSQDLLNQPPGTGASHHSEHLSSTIDQLQTLSYSEEEDEFGPPLQIESEEFQPIGGVEERHANTEPIATSHSETELNSARSRAQKATTSSSVSTSISTEDEAIALDDAEEELLADVTNEAEKPFVRGERTAKQNVKEVDEHDDYGGALLTDAEKRLLSSFSATSGNDEAKPVVRSPFPSAIRDRSPIWGASNTTVVRTCFRIGEALNVGCQAVRSNRPVLLELYARVVDSWQEGAERGKGREQNFVIHDLYHDKPPHVDASFVLCGQSKVWDLDTSRFLTRRDDGIMCRAIGQMKKEGSVRGKWYINLLSIWEATWDDVHAVAGIYAKDKSEDVSEDDCHNRPGSPCTMESAVETAVSPREVATPTKSGSKNRSFSDPPSAQAVTALQPSPTFRESVRHGSKDDHDPVITGIYTPTQQKTPFSRKPDFARGLSLQMPAPASPSAASGSANGSGWSREQPAPLSPKLDEKEIYMQTAANDLSASPATSLPRHSRGLDFSRACTNLHHSTLAERQPGMGSPGSSPVLTTKGMNIPGRKGSVGSMVLDSPAMGGSATGWGGLAPERSTVSSSVGSVNMMGSDSESSESDEDASMGGDVSDSKL
ncbi:hypothetical protein D0865_09711 [Hortaea werneckii]|uniref:Uncharacterized protein n=1 Tax=Hortaea werneckii TaxID=91943 RepID=A0A3M7C136_HORWE|nr:hypothetical protein D0865_09711 [Hortaea werneckii]